MRTKHMKEMRQRMNQDRKSWKVSVASLDKETRLWVETKFDSLQHSIKNILHLVELELMTNLHHGIDTPITVQIQEMK